MNVLLLQLDGKIPNIALMRLAYHHRAKGDTVTLKKIGHEKYLQPDPQKETSFGFKEKTPWDQIYGSLIFERSRPLAERLKTAHPEIILGGTGWDLTSSLEQHGITTTQQDYSVYNKIWHPPFMQSVGFTQRGCRLRCGFCVVPKKEGAVKEEQTIAEIWRGEPYPPEILLLDNDFFGQEHWRDRLDELHKGNFKVSFNQGINCRMLTDETAAAIASVDYRDDSMKHKRIYTAFDNAKDEKRLFDGLKLLEKHGVKPGNIMVYMLIGYGDFRDDDDEWDRRRLKLRDFGCMPYPMPFVRNEKTIGFQRYVVGNYDKREGLSWAQWKDAEYDPKKVGLQSWIDNQRLELFDEPVATAG